MKKWLFLVMGLFFAYITHAEPLPANEAFSLQVRPVDPNTFALQWTIKSGYFLYSDRIHLANDANGVATLGHLRLPPTENKTDKQGHVYTVYRNHLSIPVDVLGIHPGESLIRVSYQGCSDEGFCYPVASQDIKMTIDTHQALTEVNIEQASDLKPAPVVIKNQNEELTQVFHEHHWLMVLLIFYGFGLLLSFTPCILPMVPVLSGIIVGHGKNITTRKAFFLSLSYVLSMSVTYAVIGAVLALLGSNLQINMQSPWAIGVFSFIFVSLALSMFGFYELKLPNAWQEKIAGSNPSQRGGHYLGAAIMGCLSTLILSPCVTAPLIGVLSYITQSHNIVLGCITLFSLSLGMGTPLLLIGSSAGRLLPKAGAWMNGVKAFFGVLLLSVAIYLLSRIIPAPVTMFLWGCLFIFSSIYTGAFMPALTHQECFRKSVGMILFIYGLLILIGASMGSNNPLQPLANAQAIKPNVPNTAQTLAHIKEQITAARGQAVVLDFYADWCASCKVIEATVLRDKEVQEQLTHFKFIRIDLSRNDQEDQKIMHYFHIVAPPAFLFFNDQGKLIPALNTVGELSASEFITLLQQAKTIDKPL